MIKIGSVRKQLFSIKLKMLIGGSQKKNIGIAPTLSQYGLNLRDFTMYFESVSFFINNHFYKQPLSERTSFCSFFNNPNCAAKSKTVKRPLISLATIKLLCK